MVSGMKKLPKTKDYTIKTRMDALPDNQEAVSPTAEGHTGL